MSARLTAAVAVALLAACASTPEPDPEPQAPSVAVVPPVLKPPPPDVKPAAREPERVAPVAVEPRSTEVDVLLADFERMRRMNPQELVREHDAAKLVFSQTRSDASRVRLAMIATLQGAGEESRAVDLLEPLVKTPGAALHGLAFLLSAYIQEMRRLSGLAQGLQQNVQGLPNHQSNPPAERPRATTEARCTAYSRALPERARRAGTASAITSENNDYPSPPQHTRR